MKPSYRITEKQREWLDSLNCQRISADDRNLREVETFVNTLNETIVDSLKGEAYSIRHGMHPLMPEHRLFERWHGRVLQFI